MPTHAEQRVLPYTQEQLFALVADVEHYAALIPGQCAGELLPLQALYKMSSAESANQIFYQ